MGEEEVVDLSVAELVPGDGGDAGGGEFESGPEKRGEDQGGDQAEAAADESEEESEEAEVEAEDGAEGDDHECAANGGEMAVEDHRLVDPVAIEDVPQESGEPADEGGAAEVVGMGGLGGGEQRPEQRDEGEPGEDAAPGREGSGDRETEVEEDRGDEGEQDGKAERSTHRTRGDGRRGGYHCGRSGCGESGEDMNLLLADEFVQVLEEANDDDEQGSGDADEEDPDHPGHDGVGKSDHRGIVNQERGEPWWRGECGPVSTLISALLLLQNAGSERNSLAVHGPPRYWAGECI